MCALQCRREGCVKEDGIYDGYRVEMVQGRLSRRDVPFGPDEGAALEGMNKH